MPAANTARPVAAVAMSLPLPCLLPDNAGMAIGEFELIDRYFACIGQAEGVVLGIGDDGAVLDIPPGQQLVAVMDTLVAGVHFPPDTDPFDIGYRALAVNLSDLAAMGAQPRWFTLALTLPDNDGTWLAAFAAGLSQLALQYGLALVGGDTTRGPLTVTVQAEGLVPAGQALRRSGARPGDAIFVTGTPGDAAAGLAVHQGRLPAGEGAACLRERFFHPQPRVAIGLQLRGRATACIDVSDGLLQDLEHVLRRSGGLGARINLAAIPLSPALREVAGDEALGLALGGGDDYELCFTWPAGQPLPAGVDATRIGEITAVPGLVGYDAAGREQPLQARGYRHF